MTTAITLSVIILKSPIWSEKGYWAQSVSRMLRGLGKMVSFTEALPVSAAAAAVTGKPTKS